MTMNESEGMFKEWLDTQGYPFVFIDQSNITQSEKFINKTARPDFFIKLDNNKIIAVDIKQRTLNTKYNTFNVNKKTQDRLASFELDFNIPVWIAFTTEANAMKVWHWIGINEINNLGKLLKVQNREFWAINIEKCDILGWKDDLEKISSKLPLKTEFDDSQKAFISEILNMLAINDTELKKLIRERRKEQKRLEKRIGKVERDYMVKPSVFIKKLQKDINEKVKKLKEKLSKTFSRE